ncbi:MAG: 3-oxoadipyl-CoA thiolase [Actinobacteria bacterium]|jgi:3-oxoadipyl-CoA thiolase|nr:3-oxoadipyl-CoA thiolase [Actinomycetota bacterium]
MARALLVGGLRTPFGRYGGALASVRPDDMAALVLKGVAGKFAFSGSDVDEVILGCANQAGEDNRNVARMATLIAGYGERVPAVTVNRLCGSGLDAVLAAARMVKLGEADLVIAGGVESMSRAPFVVPKADTAFDRKSEIFDTTIGWRFVNSLIQKEFGIDSMPETAENIAEEFNIAREDQDLFAFHSQERVAKARASGRLGREIIPVEVKLRRETRVVDQDEHPRQTSLEALAKLPAPFRENGSVTAGNASGVNDGAAVVVVAGDAAVSRFGWEPLAEIVAGATAGVPPRIMGIGPVPATRKVLDRAGISLADLGVIELNEAFASQAVACLREFGLPEDAGWINPNGGAISLGHPLGASGARLALTAAIELSERGEAYALATMCVGVGQGIAAILSRP